MSLRKKDVIECIQNFIEKHWNNPDRVALPDDSDFIFKGLYEAKINSASLIEEEDSKWSFNGSVKALTTDERHSLSVSNLPFNFSARAIIYAYPNEAPEIPGVEFISELPEVNKIRILTLTLQKL